MIIKGNKNLGYRILKWKITNNCNYKCSYCFQEHNNQCIENYKEIIDFLNKNQLDNTVLRLIGGEPTIHSGFYEIVNFLKINFGLYTNLSLKKESLKKLLNNKFLHHIYCTLHLECCDYKEFIDKIKFISKYNSKIFLYVAIMIENNPLVLQVLKILKTLNINGYIIPKVIEKNGIVNNDYYNINIQNFKKYLISEQKISIDNINFCRLHNDGKFIQQFHKKKQVLCDINKYQLELINTSVRRCLLNDELTSFNKIQDKQLCCNPNKCHIFTWEFGEKKCLK